MILLTGATGFVGGRLLRALLADGRAVRCLSRRPECLADDCEAVRGDVLDASTLPPALEDVDVAYYLVHALGSTGAFDEEEAEGARNFGAAAAAAGVRRIVYLGGLAHGDDLSDHMRSRHEVGRILARSGVPTIELRASIVLGRGSLSFELVRTLVDRLPVLALPGWADAPAQPIFVDDLVAYLVAAADVGVGGSRVFEIGGADVLSYRDLVAAYGDTVDAPRFSIRVPVPGPVPSTADLPELLAGRLPERALAAAKLVESLRFDSTVHDAAAREVFDVRPRGVRDALSAAVAGTAPASR